MYSKEQIGFLMKNGFSVEEIMALDPAQEPAQEPAQVPAPDPDPTPAPAQAPTHVPADLEARVDNLVASVGNLVQMLQRQNINGIQFGSPVPERSADDILAEIINPKSK